MAGVLERHMTALEVSDPPSAVEHEVYAEVAAAHRRAADQLRAAADRMVAQRDLPMGRHDMAAMAHPEAVRAFQALVDAKRHMLAVLGETAEEDAAMLDTMRSAVRDSDLR